MIPRRDEDGEYKVGPVTWSVEREENHGDRSTSTLLTVNWWARWRLKIDFLRSWRES